MKQYEIRYIDYRRTKVCKPLVANTDEIAIRYIKEMYAFCIEINMPFYTFNQNEDNLKQKYIFNELLKYHPVRISPDKIMLVLANPGGGYILAMHGQKYSATRLAPAARAIAAAAEGYQDT